MVDKYIHAGDSPMNVKWIASRTASEYADFFLPYLRPGLTVLDCGCGPGTITLGIAEAVLPGRVVGLDIDPGQIEKAMAEASRRGVTNAQFIVGSASELPFAVDSFDAVFSHALLEHLSDPVSALREMYRVLKTGGVVGVRSLDSGGGLVGPADTEIDAARKLYQRYRQSHGGNPFVGRQLRALLVEAGYVETKASASYKSWGTTEAVQSFLDVFVDELAGAQIRKEAIEQGWADQAWFDKVATAVKRWAERPDCFFAHATCEAVGYRR